MVRFRFILIFILIFSAQLISQQLPQLQIIGKPEKSQTEFVSSSIKDANGRVCASIQVLSNLDGFKYTSYNGVVKVVDEPGKDMVYLQPDERVLEVLHTGFQPLKIILSEIGIQLKPKDVWVIKIQGKIIGDVIPVTILVEPKDAVIRIDGKLAEQGPTFKLPKGKHTINISKEQYQTHIAEIDVGDENAFFQFTLIEKQDISVQIVSEPSEAIVYLDNIKVGQTPVSIFYREGRYTIKIEKEGFVTIEEPFRVVPPNVNKSYNLEENVGWLTVNTDPKATMYLNGEITRNRQNIKLPPMVVRVRVTLPKADPLEEQVILKRNDRISLDLYPAVPIGTIQIAIVPFDAGIELKGDAGEYYTANANHIFKDIPVGKYDLRVSKNGYKDHTESMILGEGEKLTKSVKLQKIEAAVSIAGTQKDLNMVYIEGGTFQMGNNSGNSDEKPVHTVTMRSFFMGQYEVTQKEWQEAMGTNPSSFKQGNLPVEQVSWYDVVKYCNARSRKEGLTPCYTINGNDVTCDFSVDGYRLPTEAEWEYAARGGKRSKGYKYSGSNSVDEVAWYSKNSGNETNSVGKKRANELGLYDMSGNVYEWCWDWQGNYSSGSQTNPQGSSSGSYRVIRGGSWRNSASDVRVTNRYNRDDPSYSYYYVGFRLCRTE